MLVDPCIPAAWHGFTINRYFRNADYTIQIVNPNHVQKGIKEITVDGTKIQGNILPVFEDGKEHNVIIEMG